jgi:hypothetical protein
MVVSASRVNSGSWALLLDRCDATRASVRCSAAQGSASALHVFQSHRHLDQLSRDVEETIVRSLSLGSVETRAGDRYG